MLTHLIHFHIRGAGAAVASAEATYGWAQGHFLGAYLGSGIGGAVAEDEFNGGWAQGSWWGYYYGAGSDGAGVEPAVGIYIPVWRPRRR